MISSLCYRMIANGKSATRTSFFLVLAALVLAGCANNADPVITPTYISPMSYEALNCRQLAAEAQRVSGRATAATAALASVDKDKEKEKEKGRQIAAELSRLKGEIEAIELASTLKRCGAPNKSAPSPTY